jgi:hypothetical protein
LAVWVIVGLAFSFGLGVAPDRVGDRRADGAALGRRGGDLPNPTFTINSLCHPFGRRDHQTTGQSGNLACLAILTWGEAWHKNHHAFRTS